MKVKKISRAVAAYLGASLFLAPSASATGLIFVDPVFHTAPPVRVTPIRPSTPLNPRNPATPRPRNTVLQGTVSTGIHLENQDITVEIQDHVAKTYIKQTFKNDTNRNLAGTYLFPLPQDATFSSFTLHIDGKPVEGKILAAAEARAQYEQIVRKMVDPGLLEYVDYKTVRARIFPIPANGTKTVELEYTQLLKSEGGMFKYRYPLKSASASAVNETKLSMKLKGKSGLRTIWSPSHIIQAKRIGDNQAKVSFLDKGDADNKDFLLYYTVSDKDLIANLISHKKLNEKGFFLLALNPPLKAKKVMPKDIVLVADTSGSMRGTKMKQLKKALNYVVQSLNDQDRFSIVEFNTDAEPFTSKLLSATKDNRIKAESFVDDLSARGGTNIGDALSIGTNILNTDIGSTRPAYLILLTDGEPTVGMTKTAELLATVKSKRNIRLFDFGVGYDVNTKLMAKLAEHNHGTSQFLEPDENLETALSSFYSKIKNPILSDVKIAYEGVEIKDTYPRVVNDMFAGNQVMLLGRYKDGNQQAKVSLTGKINGVQKAYSFPLAFASNESGNAYLPRLWAMRRIGYLTEVAQENGDTKEVVDEIVSLSKRYGIISAYTSFLSTDPNENTRLRRPGLVPPPPPQAMPMTAWGRSVSLPAVSMGRVVRQAGSNSFRAQGARFSFAANRANLSAADMAVPRMVFNNKQRIALGAASSSTKSAAKLAGGKGFYAGEGLRGAVLSEASAEVAKKEERESFRKLLKNKTGKRAIAFQRALRDLRKDNVLADKSGSSLVVKVIDDKTFYKVNGFWVDASFENMKDPTLKNIEFGSKTYFDLVFKNRQIGKYVGAGQQVIFVFKGQCYKIVKPAVKTS